MLTELVIRDLAIIEETSITFEPGLNAITGETGAGKSILLDALGAVLGQRAASDLVRTGKSVARIEASFDLGDGLHDRIASMLEEFGIDADPDGQLLLAREIHATGRSTARVNGRLATASQLSAIGRELVDIHGQSDHLAILNPVEQRRIVDRFGRLEALVTRVEKKVNDWRVAVSALEDVDRGGRERAQRIDLLAFQIDELEQADLQPGEDERLAAERERLQYADTLRQLAWEAHIALAGDEAGASEVSAISLLRAADSATSQIQGIDGETRALAERATELLVLAEDLSRDLRDYADGIEGDPERLREVDDRLDLLTTLKRKYGSTIEELQRHLENARAEHARLASASGSREELEARVIAAAAALVKDATSLSAKRSEVAAKLSTRIVQSIADLRMGDAEVVVDVEQHQANEGLTLADGRTVAVDAAGIDHVTFLIAPNAGEALKPLTRIASGGETARIMLAIKSILSDVDETPTLVFDEIDVGVGGRSGQVVGEKLWSLTTNHQVIVISHLAQIAAFADRHFRIEKSESNGRVVSSVHPLDPLTREQELAAMLDGVPATPESLANARVMLQRVYQLRETRSA